MKSYNWTWYSNTYCEKIKLIDNSENNTLCIYEAFDNTEYNTTYFIVYKDEVVFESFNFDGIVYKFYGMLDLLKYLTEKGEIK